jgi:hypothetical protein
MAEDIAGTANSPVIASCIDMFAPSESAIICALTVPKHLLSWKFESSAVFEERVACVT